MKKKHAGMFAKGGGRVGGGSSGGGGTKVVVVAPAAPAPAKRKSAHKGGKVAKKTAKKGKRRHHRVEGSLSLAKIGGTALALASVAGTNTGPLGAKVYDLVQKIPGAKTFGGAATAGLMIGGVHHFTKFGGKFRPWMRAAGIVGVVAAAIKIGEAGMQFKWLGDPDSPFDVG